MNRKYLSDGNVPKKCNFLAHFQPFWQENLHFSLISLKKRTKCLLFQRNTLPQDVPFWHNFYLSRKGGKWVNSSPAIPDWLLFVGFCSICRQRFFYFLDHLPICGGSFYSISVFQFVIFSLCDWWSFPLLFTTIISFISFHYFFFYFLFGGWHFHFQIAFCGRISDFSPITLETSFPFSL